MLLLLLLITLLISVEARQPLKDSKEINVANTDKKNEKKDEKKDEKKKKKESKIVKKFKKVKKNVEETADYYKDKAEKVQNKLDIQQNTKKVGTSKEQTTKVGVKEGKFKNVSGSYTKGPDGDKATLKYGGKKTTPDGFSTSAKKLTKDEKDINVDYNSKNFKASGTYVQNTDNGKKTTKATADAQYDNGKVAVGNSASYSNDPNKKTFNNKFTSKLTGDKVNAHLNSDVNYQKTKGTTPTTKGEVKADGSVTWKPNERNTFKANGNLDSKFGDTKSTKVNADASWNYVNDKKKASVSGSVNVDNKEDSKSTKANVKGSYTNGIDTFSGNANYAKTNDATKASGKVEYKRNKGDKSITADVNANYEKNANGKTVKVANTGTYAGKNFKLNMQNQYQNINGDKSFNSQLKGMKQFNGDVTLTGLGKYGIDSKGQKYGLGIDLNKNIKNWNVGSAYQFNNNYGQKSNAFKVYGKNDKIGLDLTGSAVKNGVNPTTYALNAQYKKSFDVGKGKLTPTAGVTGSYSNGNYGLTGNVGANYLMKGVNYGVNYEYNQANGNNAIMGTVSVPLEKVLGKAKKLFN